MALAVWPIWLIPLIPLVSLAAIAVNEGATIRPAPLITLCEIGEGATVQLIGHDGRMAITTLTDADGNYRFSAITSDEFQDNAMRLGQGIWPVYLPESNFAPGGRLEMYRLMMPDLQYGRVPALGQAGIDEYFALLNTLVVTNTYEIVYSDPPTNSVVSGQIWVGSESNWTAADYEFLESERERLLGVYFPCFEMVRKPGASVDYTSNVVMESHLDTYAETRWAAVRSGSGVISATHVVVTAGPLTPVTARVDYEAGQVAPPVVFYTGITETLRLGPGTLQMQGTLTWREDSRYRTVGCMGGNRPGWADDPNYNWQPGRGIPDRTVNFGLGSCMDDYVLPIGGETLIGMDYGEAVITGTLTITPTFPLQSVTCSLALMSASARYCSVEITAGGDAFTVSVWDGAFAPSAASARLFWAGLGEQ